MEHPATPRDLFAFLDAQGVVHHTLEHDAVFRVEDGLAIKAALPGGHTKNLFLKDHRGQMWLICALGHTAIDLKRLPPAIGSGRLSFGSADLLHATLGVRPGSVTLFGLINTDSANSGCNSGINSASDSGQKSGSNVELVLDAALLEIEPVNFHPLTNTATTAISQAGLRQFLRALKVTPLIVDFATLTLVAPI